MLKTYKAFKYRSYLATKFGISTKEQCTLKILNSCSKTKITFYFETSGSQNIIYFLMLFIIFNTCVNYASVAASDSCFPA